MKKIILFAFAIFTTFAAAAQYDSLKSEQSVSGYGFSWANGIFRSSFKPPQDTIKLAMRDSGKVALKNGSWHRWTGFKWEATSGSGTFTTDSSFYLSSSGAKLNANWWVNVKDFGAIPNDGLSDDSAINAAIAYAHSSGYYSKVYFPNGIYDITKAPQRLRAISPGDTALCNSQIYIPMIKYNVTGEGYRTIELLGESSTSTEFQAIAAYPDPMNGVILRSTYITDDDDPAGFTKNVLGAISYGTNGFPYWNYTKVIVRDIKVTVATKDGSGERRNKMSAISFEFVAKAKLKGDVIVRASSAPEDQIDPYPQSHGYIGPATNNHADADNDNVYASGFYTGVTTAEHASFNTVVLNANVYGMDIQPYYKVIINSVISENNAYTAKMQTGSNLAIIGMSGEKNTATGHWYSTVADFTEATSNARGTITIQHATIANTGAPATPVKIGDSIKVLIISDQYGTNHLTMNKSQPTPINIGEWYHDAGTNAIKRWNGTTWLGLNANVPNLQQVTDVGSSTTNLITANSFSTTSAVVQINESAGYGRATFLNGLAGSTYNEVNPYGIKHTANSGTDFMNLLFPTTIPAGTLNLTLPKPSTNKYLVSSVNGVPANDTGNVIITSGSGTVNTGAANRLSYYPSSGTTVDDLTAITANRALISDANGLPTHSATTAVELGYSSGVTSSIQTQLNAKFTLPALTSGSALFSNGTTITQDNSNLFWDNAQKQLGVGTNVPGTFVSQTGITGGLFNIKNTSNYARIYAQGNGGLISIADLTAGSNIKQLQFRSYGGLGTIEAVNDAGSGLTQNFMEFNLSNGRIGMGGASADSLLTVNGGLRTSGGIRAGLGLISLDTANNKIVTADATGKLSRMYWPTGGGGGGGLGYNVYVANVSQSGTSAPTATVLQNTLGGTVVWTRTGVGTYEATLTGAFTSGKTWIMLPPINNYDVELGATSFEAKRISADVISIKIIDAGINFSDDWLVDNPIEIRVYP